MSSDERTLNALRRLPENRLCATCRKEDRFGHKNVCMKFRIFICSECKSAHQAFSHKCKSVTMSNWSREEVELLKAPQGGNLANMATVFAKLADDSDAYPKGCPPDEVKAFVDLAYNQLRWAGDAKGHAAAQQDAPQEERSAPSVDLFGDFSSPPPVAAMQSAPVPPAASIDLFGDFASPPPVAAMQSAPVPPAASIDLFGDFASASPAPQGTFVGSFDEASDDALRQGVNFFEAFASAPPAATLCADDLLTALSFDEAAPTVASGRAPKHSMDELDAFGTFESAAAPKSVAAALSGSKGTASPLSVLDVPHAESEVGALFSKLMAADLMAPSKPWEPAQATPTAKAATPMAQMATAKAATGPGSTPMAMGSAVVNSRPPLGADFVDLAAMRPPPAFKTPTQMQRPTHMHTPMRAPPMQSAMAFGKPTHASMHCGM